MSHEALEPEFTKEELAIIDSIFREIHGELSDEISNMGPEESENAVFFNRIRDLFKEKLNTKIKDKKRQELIMGAYNFLPEALRYLNSLREKLKKREKELEPFDLNSLLPARGENGEEPTPQEMREAKPRQTEEEQLELL